MLAKPRILYFTGEESLVYRSAGAALEVEARFAGEGALAAFRAYLENQRGALFAVLADVAGEDFHEEQVPSLRGGDREQLLARRLAQRYRDTRLAAALSLGHVTTAERRNERVLLASFTNTQLLTPWLDALEEAGARLAGVYSVPLLAPALAASLGARESRVLVVTVNRAGVRQCYVESGRLRFARLERSVELASPQALAAFVHSETQRLVQYLVTLRALPRDGGPVHAVVVAPPGERATFEQALPSDARLNVRTIDFAEALRLAKLRRAPQDALAEALFVHLAAKKPPQQQFASRDDRRRYLLWQLQRGIVAAGAAAFVVCALVGGSRWLEAMGVRERANEQIVEARNAAQRYERITASFPVTDTSTENLKVTVVEFRRIAERSASPEHALAHVSRVLERYPQFELDALRWSAGRPNEMRDAPKPAAGAKPPAEDGVLVLVELSGRVNATQRNDYRGITAQVQGFAGSLIGDGYDLARTQLPFDVTSEGTLTGDIGGQSDTGEAPRFTITLVRRMQ